MKIKQVRKATMPSEPQSLEEINIPNSFHYTLNGELFLVKNIEIGSECILLFTTKANVQHLSQSPDFSIMNPISCSIATFRCFIINNLNLCKKIF